MSKDPILAEVRRGGYRLIAHGGLHYIKGNHAPYFSLTADGWDGGEFGGACHEEILKEFPQFEDLVKLHLSDIDGVPMYAVENGFYFLGGSTARWRNTYLNRLEKHYPDFKVAAKHFRITEDEARGLVRDLFGDHFSEHIGFLGKQSALDARERLAIWVETQKPRWQQEAQACIIKHSLVLYGDEWPQSYEWWKARKAAEWWMQKKVETVQ